jgi:hypothetical protein
MEDEPPCQSHGNVYCPEEKRSACAELLRRAHLRLVDIHQWEYEN